MLFAHSTFTMAQSLTVTGQNSFTGDVITQVKNYIDVKNTSSNTLVIKCQKTNLIMPTGAASYYCFAGNCYSASSTDASDFCTIAPGQKISFNNTPTDTDAHTGYYNAYEAAGVAEVQYCFYDTLNPSDETCVIITYDCNGFPVTWDCISTGNCQDPGDGSGQSASLVDCEASCIVNDINNSTFSNLISDFFPNPANEVINFQFNESKGEFKILDILGNEVKTMVLNSSGLKSIDVEDLSKGIYFGNLIIDNKIAKIEKLIIK